MKLQNKNFSISAKVKYLVNLVFVLILVAFGYVIYVYVDYYRVPDNQKLEVRGNSTRFIQTNTQLSIVTYNVGYGSYDPSYSFFMDGGKYSRAYDLTAVKRNINGSSRILNQLAPDFILLQEVDQKASRSFEFDEVAFFERYFSSFESVFAQNYDSSYLFYPLTQPIGKSRSGLMTLADFNISKSKRFSLPIEKNFNKFFDLDRAFSVSYLPVEGNKELVLINLHLSAYSKDPTIQASQIKKLFDFSENEYNKGNYVIAEEILIMLCWIKARSFLRIKQLNIVGMRLSQKKKYQTHFN